LGTEARSAKVAAPAASSRRSFIRTAGVALPASFAAVGAGVGNTIPLSAAAPGESLDARLTRLQDENAIRALNQEYARYVNAGTHEALASLFAEPADAHIDPDVRSVAPHGFGEHDRIEIAPDRQTATASIEVSLNAGTAVAPDCTVVQMAREQGGGLVERTDNGILENSYVKRDGVWKIRHSAFRAWP
jgi:hypothetical protein